MARSFTEVERNYIREELINEFIKAMQHIPFSKVSVDDLVTKVGISKGSFYSFFTSKEYLFIEAANKVQKDMVDSSMAIIGERATDVKARLKKIILVLIKSVSEYPWLQKMTNQEHGKILRNIPKEDLVKFSKNDKYDLVKVLSFLEIESNLEEDVILGGIQIIMYSVLGKAYFGDTYDKSVEILVDGLVNQIV